MDDSASGRESSEDADVDALAGENEQLRRNFEELKQLHLQCLERLHFAEQRLAEADAAPAAQAAKPARQPEVDRALLVEDITKPLQQQIGALTGTVEELRQAQKLMRSKCHSLQAQLAEEGAKHALALEETRQQHQHTVDRLQFQLAEAKCTAGDNAVQQDIHNKLQQRLGEQDAVIRSLQSELASATALARAATVDKELLSVKCGTQVKHCLVEAAEAVAELAGCTRKLKSLGLELESAIAERGELVAQLSQAQADVRSRGAQLAALQEQLECERRAEADKAAALEQQWQAKQLLQAQQVQQVKQALTDLAAAHKQEVERLQQVAEAKHAEHKAGWQARWEQSQAELAQQAQQRAALQATLDQLMAAQHAEHERQHEQQQAKAPTSLAAARRQGAKEDSEEGLRGGIMQQQLEDAQARVRELEAKLERRGCALEGLRHKLTAEATAHALFMEQAQATWKLEKALLQQTQGWHANCQVCTAPQSRRASAHGDVSASHGKLAQLLSLCMASQNALRYPNPLAGSQQQSTSGIHEPAGNPSDQGMHLQGAMAGQSQIAAWREQLAGLQQWQSLYLPGAGVVCRA
ncbi:hypothetical protein WJX72_007800 [[Myrmecia] bisecta]|uniref:Uncharacterized protein n=1 Tax=[Myrmecia] bisecta TaxID=41462 RepID=A0AAW1PLG6_9CHLO